MSTGARYIPDTGNDIEQAVHNVLGRVRHKALELVLHKHDNNPEITIGEVEREAEEIVELWVRDNMVMRVNPINNTPKEIT